MGSSPRDRSHVGPIVLSLFAAATLVLLTLGVAFGGQTTLQTNLAPGVSARMQAADLESATAASGRAMSIIGSGPVPQATSATAVLLMNLRTLVPDLPIEEGADIDGSRVVWVIRGSGTFATNRGRQSSPLVFDSGTWIVDDATGEVIGVSMP